METTFDVERNALKWYFLDLIVFGWGVIQEILYDAFYLQQCLFSIIIKKWVWVMSTILLCSLSDAYFVLPWFGPKSHKFDKDRIVAEFHLFYGFQYFRSIILHSSFGMQKTNKKMKTMWWSCLDWKQMDIEIIVYKSVGRSSFHIWGKGVETNQTLQSLKIILRIEFQLNFLVFWMTQIRCMKVKNDEKKTHFVRRRLNVLIILKNGSALIQRHKLNSLN